MDEHEYLILVKGQDQTATVSSIALNGEQCNIVYNNSPQTYIYKRGNIQIFHQKQTITTSDYIISVQGHPLCHDAEVIDFGQFYRIFQKGAKSKLYPSKDVSIQRDCLEEQTSRNIFDYYKAVSDTVGLKVENGFNILSWQYEKTQNVSDDTVLSWFFDPKKPLATRQPPEPIIYPFGLNKSQKEAIKNALSSNISIIQGPPGTGKTQTILNIIANIVLSGKSVAVISNNNSATHNVMEKLEKKELSFLAAFLGSRKNREQFIAEQTGLYPNIDTWALSSEEKERLRDVIRENSQQLEKMFELQNRIAEIEQELLQLKPEEYHFGEYYAACSQAFDGKLKGLSSDKLLDLWLEFEQYIEQSNGFALLKRLRIAFKFNFSALKLLSREPSVVIPYIQQQFYIVKNRELQDEKKNLEQKLRNYSFYTAIQALTEDSLKYFKAVLSTIYKNGCRRIFDSKAICTCHNEFNREYPVILSTTYSVKSTLNPTHIYDYIIVDEASQVDLATAVLAFSCTKNIVIVGDLQQLPNVITNNDLLICQTIWEKYSLPKYYSYSEQNLLSSSLEVWPNAPKSLLREHYRCHPKIIEFCNHKFYDEQLIVMTKDQGEPDVLTMYRTPSGNHARKHLNQRQIDVIKEEVLPCIRKKGYNSIGIITPYNEQAQAIKDQLGSDMEIATVHKFQGREEDAIILTSVDNVISDFVDDPRMLNVAVSRAVKSLSVIISCDPRNDRTNYGELARYILYNNCEVVESKVYSVFDLLYKNYDVQRQLFLKKHRRVSDYDSENLLYALIAEITAAREFLSVGCAVHVSLAQIVKDRSFLEPDEYTYAMNPLTHIDFLLFRKIDKSPLVAIEVDGVSFHQQGSAQAERDAKKDRIFKKCGIPLLRLRTNESGEKERIEQALRDAMK